MSIRKRNEFLDGGDSEEELAGAYDSDAVEESRGAAIRNTNKRRKLDDASSDEADEGLSEDDGILARDQDLSTSTLRQNRETVGRDNAEDDSRAQNSDLPKLAKRTSASSSLKQTERARKTVRKSGVIYISRVPPFMKPHTLRHFLEPHAPKGLGKIFLTPEEQSTYQKRVKNGGNKKRSFTDGWVEFVSKTEAKTAAEVLNGNIIGGKKGNFYHDDIWNIKYLKGFKWDHLTEQIANENAERAARLRAEISKTRKENRAFVENIEMGKMLNGMASKKRAKLEDNDGATKASTAAPLTQPSREFKQRKVQNASTGEGNAGTGKDLSRSLNKIF